MCPDKIRIWNKKRPVILPQHTIYSLAINNVYAFLLSMPVHALSRDYAVCTWKEGRKCRIQRGERTELDFRRFNVDWKKKWD